MIELERVFENHFYWVVTAQIMITLVVVPLLCYAMAKSQLQTASNQLDIELRAEFHELEKRHISRLVWCSITTLLFSSWLLWSAWTKNSELLNWDNQSGLIILGMIAALPIIFTDIALSKAQAFLRNHGSSQRTASLIKRNWIGLLPRHSFSVLALLNALVIVVVVYSFYNPFPGFAGWPNFIGLIIINTIFVANLYYVCEIKRWPAEMDTEQKQHQMKKTAKVIVALWSLALFYLAVSFALSHLGPQIEYVKLASQSVYFQIMYLIALLFIKSESSSKS